MVIARLYFGITSLLTDYFLSGSVASFMYRLAKSISTSSSASSAFKQNVVQAKCYMNKKGRTRQILWGAKQMLTQKHVAKRYMIAKK